MYIRDSGWVDGWFVWLAWESAHRINREDEANRVVLLFLLLLLGVVAVVVEVVAQQRLIKIN